MIAHLEWGQTDVKEDTPPMNKKLIALVVITLLGGILLSGCKLSASTPPAATPTVELAFPTNPVQNTPVVQANTPVPPVVATPTVVVVINTPPAPVPTLGVFPTPVRPTSYTVQAYESYYCIARRFNLDPAGLMTANGSVELHPGTVLKVPSTGTWPGGDRALKAHPATYTVKSGDTIHRIACEVFGDVDPMNIALANNLAAPDYKLTVGQVLQIP
jgi:LysM repeat protein